MIILFVVNPMLACVPLVVIVVMLLFALVMNSRMKSAFKENRRRIADINSQIEDSLSGIRVVKSFGNETEEMRKFNAEMTVLSIRRRSATAIWEFTIREWEPFRR